MMNNITAIFKYEWLQLKRNYQMKWLLLLMMACAGYAIYYGNSSINKQLKNINFITAANDSVKNKFYHYFDDKKLAESVRFGWANMNSLYDGFTTENFLENNVAVNQPNSLSHLSVGQRDVYPLYRRVTARSLYYDGGGISLDDKYVETNNPHKLLAGNFDLSFVLLYLFPLFIIAFCYNIYAQEKETGSYPFLRNLPVSLQTIIAIKFLFRFCIIASMAVLFSVIGYFVTPVSNSLSIAPLLQWLFIALLYLLFWFSITWAIVAIKQNSSVTALLLVGCWINFLLIIPALVNNYIASNYKISSRTAFVEELNKQVSSIWDLPDSITLAAYYKDYPQYAQNPIVPLWTEKDTYDSLGKNENIDIRYNKKLIVWHYYLDKQSQEKLTVYNKQLLDKQSAADNFFFINPVVTTQEIFNELASSGYKNQWRFKTATAAYRDSIFNLTNKYIFENKKLTLNDYKSYPTFDINNYTSNNQKNDNSYLVLFFFVLAFFGVGFSLYKFKK